MQPQSSCLCSKHICLLWVPQLQKYNVNVCCRVKMMLLHVKFDNVRIYPADKHVKQEKCLTRW